MVLALIGVALLLVGLSAPGAAWSDPLGLSFRAPEWFPALGAFPSESGGCTDECCASVHSVGDARTFQLPFASWITMLGGSALVISHLVNMRLTRCARCG